jgi:hypothetical protein
MRKAILKMLLAASLLTGISAAWAETAGEMLSKCRPIAEAKIKDNTISYLQTLETEFCWGAFALVQGLGRWVDKSGKPVLRYCLPTGGRRGQHVAVFVEYAKKYPKRWHEDFDVVLFDSLSEAYPCK